MYKLNTTTPDEISEVISEIPKLTEFYNYLTVAPTWQNLSPKNPAVNELNESS